MRALDGVGLLADVLKHSVPMRDRVVHSPDGGIRTQPYGVREHEILHSMLREELISLVVTAAEAEPGVRFHFDSLLASLDRETGTVDVAPTAGGETRTVTADLIVGADGAFSTIRQQMQHGLRANYAQEFLPWGYKELTIPVDADGQPRVRLEALHVWPGHEAMMIAHPNRDGSLTCTLFMAHEGPVSFAALDTPTAVRDFFRQRFPDAEELMPDLVREVTEHPVGHLVTVRTDPWRYADRVVLIGDAAHAVYPFYGQGMNSAFEDCVVLDECLTAHPDRATALAAYEAARKPHTDVLADLSTANFEDLRDRVHRLGYSASAAADRLLARLLPQHWVPLYGMVAHTTIPYADALARAKRQDRILRQAGAGLALVTVLAAIAALRAGRRRRANRR